MLSSNIENCICGIEEYMSSILLQLQYQQSYFERYYKYGSNDNLFTHNVLTDITNVY